jgi:predicted esterase
MSRVIYFVLLFFSCKAIFAQIQSGKFESEFYYGGKIGQYSTIYYYVPENYDSTKVYPLILAWYGCGINPDEMRDLLYDVIAEEKEIIIVSPDLGGVDSEQEIPDFQKYLLGHILKTYNINPNQKIISGFSFGGKLAFELALNSPNDFKGIIGLSPAIGLQSFTDTMWANINRIRMATILGNKDYNFIYVDSLMNELTSRGANLLYLLKPNVEHYDYKYLTSSEFGMDFKKCYEYIIGAINVEDNYSYDFFIYPNPFSSYMYVQSEMTIDFTIYNILGSKILDGTFNDKIRTVNLEFLESGVYLVKLKTQGVEKTIKIIKN